MGSSEKSSFSRAGKKNAWLEADRAERRKMLLIPLLFIGALLGGIALLFVGLSN